MILNIKTGNEMMTFDKKKLLILSIASLLALAMSFSSVIAPTSETGTTSMNITVNVFIDITPSTGLTQGIIFDTSDPNTIVAARNNTNCASSGTCYNVTIDSATNSNIDLFDKINATFTAITVNVSASVTSSSASFAANQTLTNGYVSPTGCTNIAAAANCWLRYFADIGAAASGTQTRTYSYCGVQTGAGSGACT